MTLARAFAGNGLNGLTALNQRIIAQVADETVAEEAAEDALLFPGAEVADPDTDAGEERVELRGRFATEDPLEFNRVKEWLELNVFGGVSTGMSPLIGAFINEWDVEWRQAQGLSPSDNIGLGPTLEVLLEDERFLNGALWLPLTANQGLPPVFESSQVDEETGEEIPVVAVASPLTGVEFIEIKPDLRALRERPQTMFEVARRGRDFIRRALAPTEGEPEAAGGDGPQVSAAQFERDAANEAAAGAAAHVPGQPHPSGREVKRRDVPAWLRTMIVYSDPAAEGREPVEPLPRFSQGDLIDKLSAAMGSGSRGGGGGGGGGGRRDIVFDRNHLVAQVADVWKQWMFDPNDPPADWIGGNVDAYIREARAFWSGKGGQLDFDTYIKEKLRGHARYKTIFEHKTANETEEQFLAKFAQPIAQLGQSGEFTRMQTEQALTSGASPIEQLKRIRRTREVENSGGFSRRLAQTVQGVAI